jgi:magnesium transporter
MITTYKRTKTTQPLQTSDSRRDVWIHCVQPTIGKLHELCDELYLPFEDIQHVLDKDEKAQMDINEKYTLVVFQIPHQGKALPFSLIFTRSAVITIALAQYDFLQTVLSKPPKDFLTHKRTKAMLYLYKAVLKSFMGKLEAIEGTMETLEKTIGTKRASDKPLHEILRLQKQLIYLNTAIVANEALLEKIVQEPGIPKFEADQDLLNDLMLDNKQAHAMVKIYTEILSTLGETYSSLISHSVNDTMKILTSFTIIMTIPTIMSSFYGMNIMLPLQDHPFAFSMVLGGTLSLVLGVLVYFRWKNWI